MTRAVRNPLFAADDADEVRACLRSFDGGNLLDDLDESLHAAFLGSDDGARSYLHSYQRLTSCLLSEARKSFPDMIAELDGELMPVDAHGRPAQSMLDLLYYGSTEAPFTAWSSRFENRGDAVAVYLTSRVRTMLGARALSAPDEPLQLHHDDVLAGPFIRRVHEQLNRTDDDSPLQRIMRFFALSKSETGRLFGVSRQAVDGWLTHGVPPDRQDKLGVVLALTDLLERKLKAGRAAGVARRPADAYAGKTMLDMIAEDRHRELLDITRASFDWSQAA
jgi:hypothetical protein